MEKVADKEEKLLVLDENGNSTNRLENRSAVHDKLLFHNEIALWIIKGDEVLLQRRSPNKKTNPNKLALCAGHVVGFDSIQETIIKESMEELGLDITKYQVHPLAVLKKEEKHNHCFCHHFYIKADINIQDLTIQEEELTEILYKPLSWVIEQTRDNTGEVVFVWDEWYRKLFAKLEEIAKN